MWSIWGETIYTQAMQSIDTMSIPQEREEGWGHLSAKSRPGKNYKISVQMMVSIRIDQSMWTIYSWQLPS